MRSSHTDFKNHLIGTSSNVLSNYYLHESNTNQNRQKYYSWI